MLSSPPKVEEFLWRLQLLAKDKTLAEALMNQSVVSGVGNYVKAEALYRARLSPHRLTGSLLKEEAEALRQAIVDVMTEAYRKKGASIRTYRTSQDEMGQAQFSFRVYGKKRDPEGNNVVKEETRDGRTTHWVPTLQK